MILADAASLPSSLQRVARAVAERVWSDARLYKNRTHIALGGSCLSPLATPTSDIDLFVLAEHADSPALGGLEPASFVDVEYRSISWFESTVERLRAQELNISGSLPPFSFPDMRFLARLCFSVPLIRDKTVESTLPAIRNALRLVLAQYYSAAFVNQYQDVYGFYLARMYDSVLLSAGSLLQTSVLLAQLQERLVDPAPKWAVASSLQSDDVALRDAVGHGIYRVQEFDICTGHADTMALLNHVNAIVASATFGTIWTDEVVGECRQWQGAVQNLVSRHFEQPSRCPMGLPGYPLLADVLSRRIEIASPELMLALAERVNH